MDSEQEIAEFVETLELGEWPLERWHHDEHLVFLVWVLHHDGLEAGLPRIQESIQRHNKARGIEQTKTRGYHESLTIFLTRYAAHVLDDGDDNATLLDELARVREAMSEFRTLVFEYYTREVLETWEARTTWVPPDVKPLPG